MTPRHARNHRLSILKAWAPTAFVVLLCGAFVGVALHAAPGSPDSVLVKGFTYMGNASCAGSGCHSEDEPWEAGEQLIGDESNIWAESDPHNHGYTSLEEDASKEMGAKLKIADVTTDARCLACHAINAPKSKRGELFNIKDAVGCESCHGPGEKYLKPHAEEGWTAKQRRSGGAKGLLSKFGLRDTSDLGVRAEMCVSCHLKIDQDMLDAGHPPLEFEMYAYNYYISSKEDVEYAVHWDDTVRGAEVDARLWAVGQAAANAATGGQMAVYKTGASIAKQFFGSDSASGLASADITAANAAAAANKLAEAAPIAKTPADRRVIAHGVVALASSSHSIAESEVPDALWEAWETALGHADDGGDAYGDAVAAMAKEAAN